MNDWQLTDRGNWTNGTATVGLVHGERGWRWGIFGTDESFELWSDATRAATAAAQPTPVPAPKTTKARRAKARAQ